ncbi:phosphotransferase [Cohnella hashimotonis]|uniref:Phosphotransferase n=1 Tax=Cohnella hashimotonis TaxID=2826895 RepID=A0ABT6TNT2_9BACL|nr:phosphotransferase [Cohnella hashimotonis]MDI4647487.1 phosphotransferase [Cohnella hashimotonis]
MDDLQFLFQDPILRQTELNPGYDDHASDVWLVQTEREEVVVRSTRMRGLPDNDFWFGCSRLFGINPRHVDELAAINRALRLFTSIPVPQVIRKGSLNGREYLVVEKLQGSTCRSFIGLPSTALADLGTGIASLHRFRSDWAGTISGSHQTARSDFHDALIHTMIELVDNFYSEHQRIRQLLPSIIAMVKKLPVPSHFTFVLIDMDPTQFLTNGSELTGLVDTEVYALAPREFDFIGLEYVLDELSAKYFKQAYAQRLALPNLESYRLPYRFFYRLLRVQGSVDVDEWLNHPVRFK